MGSHEGPIAEPLPDSLSSLPAFSLWAYTSTGAGAAGVSGYFEVRP